MISSRKSASRILSDGRPRRPHEHASDLVRLSEAVRRPSRSRAAQRARQVHPSWGIDYFVFTRGLLDPVPPFAVGRPSFDNWFIYRARSRRAPVIDATPAVLAVHQNHDYSYHPNGWRGIRESEEALENLRL